MTEKGQEGWIHRWSLKAMPGWTEERLTAKVRELEIKSLRKAKKEGKKSDYVCLICGKSGGIHVYRWGIAYAGKNNDALFGLERWYTTLCLECIQEELKRWLELDKE